MRAVRRDGRMIAQDQGVPVHAGVARRRRARTSSTPPATSSEGDVFLHNDPYNGGTHQADGLVCRPIFVEGALARLRRQPRPLERHRRHGARRLVGRRPGRGAGGADHPGGAPVAAARSCRTLRRLLLRNVRLPVQLWGDIQAQIASNIIAERRVRGARRPPRRRRLRGRRRGRARLQPPALPGGARGDPDGEAEASDVIEDDAAATGRSRSASGSKDAGGRRRATSRAPTRRRRRRSTRRSACTKAAVVAAVVAVADPTCR